MSGVSEFDNVFIMGEETLSLLYRLIVNLFLLKSKITQFFLPYHNQPLILLKKYLPYQEFLTYHNKEIFLG